MGYTHQTRAAWAGSGAWPHRSWPAACGHHACHRGGDQRVALAAVEAETTPGTAAVDAATYTTAVGAAREMQEAAAAGKQAAANQNRPG